MALRQLPGQGHRGDAQFRQLLGNRTCRQRITGGAGVCLRQIGVNLRTAVDFVGDLGRNVKVEQMGGYAQGRYGSGGNQGCYNHSFQPLATRLYGDSAVGVHFH